MRAPRHSDKSIQQRFGVKKIEILIKKYLTYNAKISEIETKYFTTSDHNKFTGEVIDGKIKKRISL